MNQNPKEMSALDFIHALLDKANKSGVFNLNESAGASTALLQIKNQLDKGDKAIEQLEQSNKAAKDPVPDVPEVAPSTPKKSSK